MIDQTLAILGLGKIGGLLADAFLSRGLVAPGRLVATVRHPERAEALSKRLPFAVHTDNREAAA
ncbi:MAG TPA: NAD(P)-binding domain-containing protein, partial [Vicinamibacteria bacterium]